MTIFGRIKERVAKAMLQKIAVGFIERTCGSYITTIISVLCIALFAFNNFGTMIPAQYHALANDIAILVQGVALALAHDSKSDKVVPIPVKLPIVLLILGLSLSVCALPARAQDVTLPVTTAPASKAVPNSTIGGFVAESSAVAFHFNGTWSAATHITESYDFYDFGTTKNNRLYLSGHQFLAPTSGINIYGGGIKIAPDDLLNSALKKFNVPANTLSVEFSAALGNGIPTTGGSHISALIDGRLKYRASSALAWNMIEAGYVQFGSQKGATISTGLSYIFGGPKN